MRYIIALLAAIPNPFIQEAQEQFSAISEGYLLSGSSLPHVTLAQFYLSDKDALLDIWHTIQDHITDIPQPKFTGMGFTKKAKNLWGASLSVEREPGLVKLHHIVVETLKTYNIQCISDMGELYRPHLTLARIKELKVAHFNDSLLEITPFVLALGQGDENGQYLTTIFSSHLDMINYCNCPIHQENENPHAVYPACPLKE